MMYVVLQKARPHKFVRREGTKGSWTYFYKEPELKNVEKFLEEWTFTKHANLTPEIEQELSKYRPEQPVKLYRANKIGTNRPLQSWTYEKGLADAIVEYEKGYELLERVVKPEEILVDISKLPAGLKGKFIESEVIVRFSSKTNSPRKAGSG